MPKSFAQKVRDVIGHDLADREEFTCQDIAVQLDLITNKEKKPHLQESFRIHQAR